MAAGPDYTAVLATLEKLMGATDRYVEEQDDSRQSALEAALDEHYQALMGAKERIKAAVIGLTRKEFDAATPEGKLVVATKLQEDMGKIGVRGALSCAFAGFTGSATKLHKAWADRALFDSEHQVKEASVPKRRNETVPPVIEKPEAVLGSGSGEPQVVPPQSNTDTEQEPTVDTKVDETTAPVDEKTGSDTWGVGQQLSRLMSKLGKRTEDAKAAT